MSWDKAFQPAEFEPRVRESWAQAQLFRAEPESGKPRFSLVIPPPNVTGSLHVGHALDYTLQDIVIRWARMNGADALWVPGTDHAGIATQMVVERELKRETGKSRHEIGREAFVELAWKFKADSHDRIVQTLSHLGVSCDWSRERFTMDAGFSAAVRETFVRLYESGLIHRGERLINWCPSCRTALSDLEVERDEPESGELWSFAYPLEGGGEIVVATTRPETMLGDTAVAVHPEDERWKGVIGRRVLHPFFPERDIRVIADPILANPETGTGAVKVTPAHDPNDFLCGKRHGLEQISIFDLDAKVNQAGGKFVGLERREARRRVKQELAALGLDRGSKAHSFAPGRCQRSRDIVEPMISTQWFVKMEPLAAEALAAVRDGRIEIVPKSWEKTYFHWLQNIQDWCVSRQLWWGHRIPAWYCENCPGPIVSRTDPSGCPSCGGSVRQDEDVLDTWFSSQLWPFGVFGWPESSRELAHYYPTDLLVTGFDILFFWVARMIMSGLWLTGQVPFRTVLLHGMVRDAQGQKMSKSRGNAIEPELAMQAHGVDAVRFTLASMASPGSDVALSEERLAGYRAFMNKLWNATRFLLMRLPDDPARHRSHYRAEELDRTDRLLLASYLHMLDEVRTAMEAYRFDHAAAELYHFLWHSFCDWSIELAKPDLIDAPEARRSDLRRALMIDVLDQSLRLLHPIAPLITEELWQQLPRREGDPLFLAVAPMPSREAPGLPVPPDLDVDAVLADAERWLIEPVRAARALRAGSGLPPSARPKFKLKPRQPRGLSAFGPYLDSIRLLTQSSEVIVIPADSPDEPARVQSLDHVDVIMPLEGLIDSGKERERLGKERDKAQKDLLACRGKLANPSFAERAPADVVAKERERVTTLEARLTEIERQIQALG